MFDILSSWYDKLPLNISFAYYPYYYCKTINKRISSHAQSLCNIGRTCQYCLCFFSCGTICSLWGDWSCFVVKPGFNPEDCCPSKCILSVFQADQLQCNNGLCISLEKRWKFFKHITESIQFLLIPASPSINLFWKVWHQTWYMDRSDEQVLFSQNIYLKLL